MDMLSSLLSTYKKKKRINILSLPPGPPVVKHLPISQRRIPVWGRGWYYNIEPSFYTYLSAKLLA